MEPVHHIAASSKTLFARVRKMVPPLLEKFHKGQLGRVAVIGGSTDYTGAPYFAAMAAAKLGCDMSHVICERSAAPIIKAYSPDLMVHPILPSSASVPNPDSTDALVLAGPIIAMLPRLHVLVIGPGLGRDTVTHLVVQEVMKEARSRSMPFVLDADALLLVIQNPNLIKGYPECILTPNLVEFSRLSKAFGVEALNQVDVQVQSDREHASGSPALSETEKRNRISDSCEKLARTLGGVTILQKGRQDIISNGVTSIISDVEGGLKRTGGQGDTLTGSLGTFLAWRASYHTGLWDDDRKKPHDDKVAQTRDEVQAEIEDATDSIRKMSPTTSLLLVAYAGSSLTRECSRRAFKEKGRSLQASDLTGHVYDSFLALIGEPKVSLL